MLDRDFRHRRAAACSATALMLVLAAPALAQEVAPATVAGGADAAAMVPGDIVVTATRRAESLSKVPLSITAYSQANLDARGIRDIRDVIAQTPGIDITRTGGAASQSRIVIRGIDSTAGGATSAIYIDDTPVQARNSSLNYNGSTIPFIFDIDRVEVLRGPQGTLFGASAQGGAIRFITPTPSLTDYSAYGRASVSTVDGGGTGYEAGLAVGGPIVRDRIGLRVSGYYRRDAGWIDRQSWEDPTDTAKNVNRSSTLVGRASLRVEIADWLTATPSIYYQDIKVESQSLLWAGCPATIGSPAPFASLNPCPNGVADPSKGKYLSYTPLAEPSRDKFTLPSLRVVADAGPFTVTSVTSWFSRHVEDTNDATNNNARVYFGNNYLFPLAGAVTRTVGLQNPNIYQRNFMQELRVTGGKSDDRIRYTIGAFYSRSRVFTDLPITLPTYAALYQIRFGTAAPAARFMVGDAIYYGNENTIEKDYSAYANVDIKLFNRLTLTLGGRYSSDKLNFNVTERGVSYASTNGVATVIGRQKNKPFVPKASLAFQATPTALYYATYSEGYRTGGVNKTLPSTCTAEAARLGISPQTYDPDRTKNYEIGTKNRIMGGAIQYEASGFYIKWNNIQQQLRLDCAFSLVTNSGSATSKGFDLNLTIRPSKTLTIGFAAGYVNATYDRTIQFSTAPVLVAGQTLGANVTPWTINLNGEYHLPVERYDPYVRVQYNLKTANKGLYLYQVPTSTTYDPTRRYLDDIESLDVRAGMQFGNFNVALYTENLLNNHAFTSYNPAFAGSSLVKATTNRPRTIGLQMFARY
jgi:outer membrane receptor protein involved in Fe transport